ncbi:MAG TPA: AraC family transcriptional regulator [Mycobacteriales bacterium]|jgi:AraC family L-rhamnose operon transcriptional activator RhaR|nr:AraC family transcriptional regulator [Mycobacteriales bacterium]
MAKSPSRPVAYRQDDLFGAALLPLYTNVAELDGDLETHTHDFLEIAVVGSGSGRHVTSGGSPPVHPGDVFVLRPGAWHGFADCHRLVVANCCVGSAGLSGDLAFLQSVPELRELLWTGPVTEGRQGVLATSVPASSARRAVAEIRRLAVDLRRREVNRVLLMSRLLTVLGGLARPAERAAEAPQGTGQAVVAAAVRSLDSVPEHPWTVAELAATVNVDPAYLSRLFHRHVGLPPIDYLARLRTERASTLLARTSLPVARVGAAVGWTDPSYFTRRFRTLSGLTPSAYRARSRSDAAEAHSQRTAGHA